MINKLIWRAGRWRYTARATTTITPPTTWKGLDATAYIPEQAWFDTRFKEGFRLYAVHSTEWGGTAPWWRTVAQLRMALSAGMKVAAYTRDPSTWAAGITACGPYVSKLQFFAIDVESEGADGGPGKLPTRAMVDGIKAMGVRPVLYTGSGMWPAMMGSSTAFGDVPLWDTDTSSPPASAGAWVPNMNSPTPVQYGGWNTPATKRVIVQQAFNVVIDGITVDLNSVDPTFLLDK